MRIQTPISDYFEFIAKSKNREKSRTEETKERSNDRNISPQNSERHSVKVY